MDEKKEYQQQLRESYLKKAHIPNIKHLNKLSSEADNEVFDKLKKIDNKINHFVDSGYNLYLYSANNGNGKTTWASYLLHHYIYNCCKDIKEVDEGFYLPNKKGGVFVPVLKFLFDTKDNFDVKSLEFSKYIDTIKEAELVVWDDIPEYSSTYDKQLLFQLIDYRIINNLSNIFTGNLNKTQCEKILGNKLASRVFSGLVFEFKGRDMRIKSEKTKKQIMQEFE